MCKNLYESLLSLSGDIPRKVKSLDHLAILYLIFEERETVFQSSGTILHPHQRHPRVPVSPRPGQPWPRSLCLALTILVGVKCYHTVVLTGSFLVAYDVEHLHTCLLATFFYKYVYFKMQDLHEYI